MSLFAISDLHLSFGNGIDKPMDKFGGAWVLHDRKLKEKWERLVEPSDTVVVPGDISWGLKLQEAMADLDFIDRLPGKKILLRGNHDLWWSSMAKMKGLFKSIDFIQNDAFEGENFILMGSRLWLCPGAVNFKEESDRKIYERELIRLRMSANEALKLQKACLEREGISKVIICAAHFPPENENKESSGFTEIIENTGCSICVFGHLHGEGGFSNAPEGMRNGCRYILVSLDRLDCAPLRILA